MQSNNNTKPANTEESLAAVDLGSNSFHMVISRISSDGGIQIVDKHKEMVRLGAGLDKDNNLSDEAQQRALDCLERFGQRLKNIKPENVRIVGTNTLRMAKNSGQFLYRAQQQLGHSIEIISGIEEARLIYLGVSHSIAGDGKRRLVIDIGGGSTETIIGEKFKSLMMESLYMGCVSYSRRFFSDGDITKEKLKAADIAARLELESISHGFIKTGWEQVVGASGTIRAIAAVIQEQGYAQGVITIDAMKKLRKELIAASHIDKLSLAGLSEERRPVFIGGFSVLYALFKTLKISEMTVSDGAVREGLIYDILGRIKHEDVRENTIQQFSERYSIHTEHANNVANTAINIYQQVTGKWNLNDPNYKNILRWAAQLHEIGLTIAHAGYHKHGAYLAENSDMPGFSFQDQQLLAVLIRTHRQKFSTPLFESLPNEHSSAAIKLSIILRLAVILHRNREASVVPELNVSTGKNNISIQFPTRWLDKHAMTLADLKQEQEFIESAEIKLDFK